MSRNGASLREAALALAPRHVLIVEGDAAERARMATLLRDDGYAVTELVDGADTAMPATPPVVAGGRASPYVVVADLGLALRHGLDTLELLRANGLRVPVILVGAVRDVESVIVAATLGAAAVFRRPFDLDDFRTAVRFYAAG